jgi:Maf-like protein
LNFLYCDLTQETFRSPHRGNKIFLGKPTSIEQAKEYFALYGQHPCSVVGSIILTHLPSQQTITGTHVATIHFVQTLTATKASEVIDEFIQNGLPILSHAGGLIMDHPLTHQYVDHIDGSEHMITGLCPNSIQFLTRLLALQIAKAKTMT